MGESLNAIRNRPRFKIKTTLTPEEFTEQLKKYKESRICEVESEGQKFSFKITSQETYIEVLTPDDPVWKPRLTLRAEEEPGECTYIRGIFGPRPSVWTLFMFLYIGLGTTLITLGCLYYSMHLAKSKNDEDFNWVGIASIFCIIGLIITYAAVKLGQIKSRKQMQQLRKFAENVVLKFEQEEDIKN
ncbi:hypothetical protein O2K51_13250 [Apibacter raozihei]|uniref:hypothetical protein n=1 Tax=Apibacter raozihei TaxID=2500547 RepID=UPI000FE30449|nr:hypothetical protein [Apibacter raozihei]